MKETLELIDKWGVKPLLFMAIIWLNNRLTTVEANLMDCYESQIKSGVTKQRAKDKEQVFAILPTECKRKNEKYIEYCI